MILLSAVATVMLPSEQVEVRFTQIAFVHEVVRDPHRGVVHHLEVLILLGEVIHHMV